MAIVAAELLARVSADTTRAQRDLSAFSRHLQDTTTGWNRMLTGAGKALGVAFGAAGGFAAFAGVTSLTGAVQSLVGEAADAYAYSERLRMSLSSMAAKEFLQSGQAVDMASALDMAAGRAQELEYWIRQVAIESPFDRRGVADAFRMAMTYGFTSEQAQRLTQATIDFSTATGQSGEVMQRIALALGQIQSRGKLAGQELNQLSEAGVNARQILADAFGVSTAKIMEMMERGLIPANIAIEAILSDMERNYAGAGKRAQESLMGVLNTLGDLKEARLEDLFGPTFASAVVPALSQLASIMQSPEFIGATKEIGKELGVWSALQLGGLSENVERIVAAINAGPDNTPTWMTALAALTGAQSTVTPRIGAPEAGEMPEVGFGELEIPVTAVLTNYRWEGAADGGHFEIEVDAKGNLTKIDLYGGDTTGWDGGKFEGGRLVIDTAANVVKVGYGAGSEKDLFAVKLTADWREGTLVQLAGGAYNAVAAKVAEGWNATVNALIDWGDGKTEPPSEWLASVLATVDWGETWSTVYEAAVNLIPDISAIQEILSQPFQVVANFVTGNAQEPERTTETLPTPATPDTMPIDITLPYDSYGIDIPLQPDPSLLDAELARPRAADVKLTPLFDWNLPTIGPVNKPDTRTSASTSATVRIEPDTAELDATLAATRDTTANVDADWGATWEQIYTARVDFQPTGPVDVQVNIVGGSHNFPRRSLAPTTIDNPLHSDDIWATGEAMGGIHPGGRAMVGELGPELAFFDGAWQLLGENGPQVVNLPAGVEIIPADKTRRLLATGAPEMTGALPFPRFGGYADGATGTAPTPVSPDLKAAGAAAAAGDWATYKALMGLTDAVDANTGAAKAQSKALSELATLLSGVEGLFGTSQVTAEQMELAELGVPQNFADDYLRRLTDEVMNGVDWEGVDIGDAAARAGIDPNLPAEAILSMFRNAWADSSLFADAQNLDLINQDAVQAQLQRQKDSEAGQANIMALFGIGEGDLVAQIQGLDLAGAFTSALGEDAMAPVGEAVVAGIGASVEGGAIEIADGLTSGYATALGTPEQQAALAALGEASLLAFAGGWRDAASSYDWAGALPTVTPTGSTTTGTGAVTGVTGVTDPTMLADGGHVARGGWAVVGERGPELAYLPSGTNVYDAAASRRGGGVNVTVNVTANTPLDWEVAAQRIGEVVARKQRRR